MSTTTIQVELNTMDFPLIESFLKKFKTKIKVLDNEKTDPTLYSKEEYAAMLDRARNGEFVEMSRKEMHELLFRD